MGKLVLYLSSDFSFLFHVIGRKWSCYSMYLSFCADNKIYLCHKYLEMPLHMRIKNVKWWALFGFPRERHFLNLLTKHSYIHTIPLFKYSVMPIFQIDMKLYIGKLFHTKERKTKFCSSFSLLVSANVKRLFCEYIFITLHTNTHSALISHFILTCR